MGLLKSIAGSKVATNLINAGMILGTFVIMSYVQSKYPEAAPAVAAALTGANGLAPSSLLTK